MRLKSPPKNATSTLETGRILVPASVLEPAPVCAITGVTVSPTSAALVVGQTLAVAANVTGSAACTAAQLAVTYSSSDATKASVNATSGVVSAVAAGSATITVEPRDANGVLLGPLAKDLARAGLRRINVSLDSLQPETFARLNGRFVESAQQHEYEGASVLEHRR